MESIIEDIRVKLQDSADEKYREFSKSLVPGDTVTMLGVRMPRLREIAKEISRQNGREYICAVMEEERRGQIYHEELLLHGMVIGYLKCDTEERKELLDGFVPVIDSWAVCDSCCMTYKFMKKSPDEWFAYLLRYADSSREYEIRFAVVSLLDHFITEEYIGRVLTILENIGHEGYYVKMAVAWAVSVCYVKFPDKTRKLLENGHLDDFTQNKSIQKIRESYRVSKEEKEQLIALRRPKKKQE